MLHLFVNQSNGVSDLGVRRCQDLRNRIDVFQGIWTIEQKLETLDQNLTPSVCIHTDVDVANRHVD